MRIKNNYFIFFSLLVTTVMLAVEQSLDYAERSILYAPWRDTTYAMVAKDFQTNPSKDICPFCIQCAAHNDAQYNILFRGQHYFILLNAYPYSKGHILIIPTTHVATLKELSRDAHAAMIELTIKTMDILTEILHPEGFNVGFNFNRIAGASVPYHLHIQIVPRYPRNLGFIDTIGNSTVITFNIQDVYQQLLPAFKNMQAASQKMGN